MSRSVVVIGSLSHDLVISVPRLPEPGETMHGGPFHFSAGGKGANQAVAAARLGADVSLVGAVGDDSWGADLRAAMAGNGVDVQAIAGLTGTLSGLGVVTAVQGGRNMIVVAPGANEGLSEVHISEHRDVISSAEAVVLELEVPIPALERAVEIAKAAERVVIASAAPARELPADLLAAVDILVANEVEARAFAHCEGDVSPLGIARRINALGPSKVIVTRGPEGALYFDGESKIEQAAFVVESIDNVGAGDAFVGALAVAHAEGMRSEAALAFACAAGSLATTASGAIASMPGREEVERLVSGEE